MGTILTAYGDDAYDHQGYVAQVLDDGSLTSAYNNDTAPRMIGQVVAACDCGWTGTTRYPSPEPFDALARELALDEWERDHARPTLEGLHAIRWDRLATLLRQLAEAPLTRARLSDLTPTAQRELIDRTLAALTRATKLAHQLRAPPQPASGEQP